MKATGTVVTVLTLFGLFAPFTITGCRPTCDYKHHSKTNAFSDGTSYYGLWRNDELEYIVFKPFGVKVDTIVSSGWPGENPISKGLTIIPEGLYCDGKRMDTSGMRKVFVALEEGGLRPIPINQEHLRYLRLSNTEELDHSPVWLFFQNAIQGVPGPGVPESY